MRRSQDSMNPRTRADFMVLSRDDTDHPYWYGRIIGVFHVEVRHAGPQSKSLDVQHLEVIWVRWYNRDKSHRAGWKRKRLHRVSFFPSDHPSAFGFLDPGDIVRGVHLIPGFAYEKTSDLLPRSLGRPRFDKALDDEDADEKGEGWIDERDQDWRFYYLDW